MGPKTRRIIPACVITAVSLKKVKTTLATTMLINKNKYLCKDNVFINQFTDHAIHIFLCIILIKHICLLTKNFYIWEFWRLNFYLQIPYCTCIWIKKRIILKSNILVWCMYILEKEKKPNKRKYWWKLGALWPVLCFPEFFCCDRHIWSLSRGAEGSCCTLVDRVAEFSQPWHKFEEQRGNDDHLKRG